MGDVKINLAATSEIATTFTGNTVEDINKGVVYTFNDTVTYGYYWNGDPFVVSNGSDVTITSITPEWDGVGNYTLEDGTAASGRIMNGAMVQPNSVEGVTQGFDDSTSYFPYNGALNLDPSANGGAPLVVSATTHPGGASVVKAVSQVNLQAANDRQHIHKYSVLTVVPSAPPANAFRPPVVGTNKSTTWTTDDVNYNILQSVAPVANQHPITSYSFFKEATFLSWMTGSEAVREFHPEAYHEGYNDYQLDDRVIPALMALNTNIPNSEKADVFAGLVQQGIDYCGSTVERNIWLSESTHIQLFPPVMALAVRALNDDAYLASAFDVPKQDQDFFYVPASMIGVTYPNINSSETPSFQVYEPQQEGLPDWRITDNNPDPSVTSAYRGINTDNVVIQALLMDMAGARSTMQNPAFFDYAERMRHVLSVSPNLGSESTIHRQDDNWTAFIEAYYSTYYAGPPLSFFPEAPTIVSVEVIGNDALVSIAEEIYPGSSPITRVDMRYKPFNSSVWTEVQDTGMSHTFSNLTEGEEYFFGARFTNSVGTGPWSYNKFRMNNKTISSYLLTNGITTQAEYDAAGGSTPYRQTGAYMNHLIAIANGAPGYENDTLDLILGTARANANIPSYINFVNTSGAAVGAGASATVPLPPGTQEGDYIVAVLASDDSLSAITIAGVQNFATSTNNVGGRVVGRFVGAADAGLFVDATANTGRQTSVFMAAFRNVSATPTTVGLQIVEGISDTAVPAGITPTTPGQVAVIAYCLDDYSTGDGVQDQAGFTYLGGQGNGGDPGVGAFAGMFWQRVLDTTPIAPTSTLCDASRANESVFIVTLLLDPA